MNQRNNLGEEIKTIVHDAMKASDFQKLNREISDVVNVALDEARKAILEGNKSSKDYWKSTTSSIKNEFNKKKIDKYKVYQEPKQFSYQPHQYKYNSLAKQKEYKPTSYKNNQIVPVGQISSVLLTVFGVIGSVGFGIATLVMGILSITMGLGIFLKVGFGLGIAFIIFMIISMKGSNVRKRLKRFQRYNLLMRGKNYGSIQEFASSMGNSVRYTVKDLKNMISIGMFPQGRITKDHSYFMVNDETFQQYIALEQNQNRIEQQIQEEQKEQKKDEQGNQEESQKLKIQDEGQQFLNNIRTAKEGIEGQEVSLKVKQLESITSKIFEYVKNKPEKLPEIRKFTEYFLPTTIKLLVAYKELEHQPIQGENITSAKKEIENALDTINIAFENLLDDLFEDMAMDISTDISVLNTMLAQEGLTDQGMKSK